MALGPLLSLPLSYLPDTTFLSLPINPITAAGTSPPHPLVLAVPT